MHVTGGSVLLESRPDDIAIDMTQLSHQRQQQQQIMNEQVNTHLVTDTIIMADSIGPVHTGKSRDNGEHRINHRGTWRHIQTIS